MNDIGERLRIPVMLHSNAEQTNAERREAADKIERLTALARDIIATCNDPLLDDDEKIEHIRDDARRALEQKP